MEKTIQKVSGKNQKSKAQKGSHGDEKNIKSKTKKREQERFVREIRVYVTDEEKA